MKKTYTLLLALILILPASYAQKGLNIGLNGQYTAITIVNQNSWGNGHEYDYVVTNGNAFGFDIGYNFTNEVGFYTGFGMMTLGQDYSDLYKAEGSEVDSSWERTLRFKYNVIPIMFKFTGDENRVNFIGGFGMLYAMMKSAEQTWTQDGKPYTEFLERSNGDSYELTAKDVTDRFEDTDIIVNLELGARIFVLNDLYIDATFNFGYGLKDINTAGWRMNNTDDMYSASHNAYGGFKIGVAYILFGEDE